MATSRQAAHKARKLAEGLVYLKKWVHPEDAPRIKAYAQELDAKRRAAQGAGL